MRASSLLLLLLLLALADGACDARSQSYAMCASDPVCRHQMYIEENGSDEKVFWFVYEWALNNYQAADLVTEAMCPLSGNHTLGKRMWLSMMRRYRFCEHENEYYELDLGCICRTGKECRPKRADERIFHLSQSPMLAYVILVAFVVILGASYYNLKQMKLLVGNEKKSRVPSSYVRPFAADSLPSTHNR